MVAGSFDRRARERFKKESVVSALMLSVAHNKWNAKERPNHVL
jgi:hypothetical protein